MVLRHAGWPVAVDGVMTAEDVERCIGTLTSRSGTSDGPGTLRGPAADCRECAACDHHEFDIRPVAHGADLDWLAARRAGRRLARELAQAPERAEAA